MLDLKKYYGELEAYELVEVLESLHDYKSEVIAYCKERLRTLNISDENLKSLAVRAIKKRFYAYFTSGDYLANSPIFIDSYFLNEKEVKKCFLESKGEYIQYLECATDNLPF
ncbi:MAG: hypothetical protein WBA61_11325 [Aequorivita sp.]